MSLLSEAEIRRIQSATMEGREAPDGPILDRFDPQGLAAALEHEITRTIAVRGNNVGPRLKISIHLDLDDARELAKALRRLFVVT